jgi:hypothetical protein
MAEAKQREERVTVVKRKRRTAFPPPPTLERNATSAIEEGGGRRGFNGCTNAFTPATIKAHVLKLVHLRTTNALGPLYEAKQNSHICRSR